jgi:predicted RNA-binding protein with PIN domain
MGTRHDKLASVNFIIDGHNLIAQIPGMSLSMVDDEERLIKLLNQYAKLHKGRPLSNRAGRLEVYFDGAPIGEAGERNYGRVQAHFVTVTQTADEAIRNRLAKLGKSARNWKVVSSDRSIQAAAREMHASVLNSQDFTRLLLEALRTNSEDSDSELNQPLSPAEVEEWLEIFKQRKSIK